MAKSTLSTKRTACYSRTLSTSTCSPAPSRGYIADAAKNLGGSVKFVDAVHFVKGEGVGRKEEDSADEVASQMNMGT